MSTEAEEACKVLATEQEFWSGKFAAKEETLGDIPIHAFVVVWVALKTVFPSTWLTKTAQ